jgi:hypothetical protein
MKDHPEWRAAQNRHRGHMARMAERGGKLTAISVANRATEREQKVTVCRGYCHTCGLHLNDILWRYWSPLNRTQEKMPLIADRQEAPTPS